MSRMGYKGASDATKMSVLEQLEDPSSKEQLDLQNGFIAEENFKPFTDDVEHVHCVPWRTSVQVDGDNSPPLTHTPFWEFQSSCIKELMMKTQRKEEEWQIFP